MGTEYQSYDAPYHSLRMYEMPLVFSRFSINSHSFLLEPYFFNLKFSSKQVFRKSIFGIGLGRARKLQKSSSTAHF